jgi:hypothetical protein
MIRCEREGGERQRSVPEGGSSTRNPPPASRGSGTGAGGGGKERNWRCQARVAQSRARVLPEPVGDSSRALALEERCGRRESSRAARTLPMKASCGA